MGSEKYFPDQAAIQKARMSLSNLSRTVVNFMVGHTSQIRDLLSSRLHYLRQTQTKGALPSWSDLGMQVFCFQAIHGGKPGFAMKICSLQIPGPRTPWMIGWTEKRHMVNSWRKTYGCLSARFARRNKSVHSRESRDNGCLALLAVAMD
jgi:hypothetical protein